MRCSECGRPALAQSHRKKGCRLRRKKHPHAIRNHDLCFQCFERLTDQLRALLLAEENLETRQP